MWALVLVDGLAMELELGLELKFLLWLLKHMSPEEPIVVSSSTKVVIVV